MAAGQATIETQGPQVPFHIPAAQGIRPITAAQDGIALNYAPPFTVPNQMLIANPYYQQTHIYLSCLNPALINRHCTSKHHGSDRTTSRLQTVRKNQGLGHTKRTDEDHGPRPTHNVARTTQWQPYRKVPAFLFTVPYRIVRYSSLIRIIKAKSILHYDTPGILLI